MAPAPYKRVFTGILEAFERIAYLTISFALSVPIVMLVISLSGTPTAAQGVCSGRRAGRGVLGGPLRGVVGYLPPSRPGRP